MQNLSDKLYHMDVEEMPGWKVAGVRVAQFIFALGQEFNKDGIIVRASGLAYTSLLAVVPLIAVLFAMFSAFASFEDVRDKVQNFLFTQFLPTRQDEIVEYLNKFTQNTQTLGLIGFLALMFTAVALLANIEKNFNEIWSVTKPRSFINKMTTFTSILVFGTMFLGASFSLTAKFKSLLSKSGILDIGFLVKAAFFLAPYFLTFFAFFLMYMLIPHTRIKYKSAAFGAFLSALLWEIAKIFVANSMGKSVKYDVIYGSLAIIPIFLVWLYITWVIVLVGLEFVYIHQNFRGIITHRQFHAPNPRDEVTLSVQIFTYIAGKFYRRESPPTMAMIADEFVLPIQIAGEHVGVLMRHRLLHEVGEGPKAAYVPGFSIDQMKLAEVVRAIFSNSHSIPDSDKPLEGHVNESMRRFEQDAIGSLGEITVSEFVKDLPADKKKKKWGKKAEPEPAPEPSDPDEE